MRLLTPLLVLGLLTACGDKEPAALECVLWTDGCNDPCTPLCTPADEVPSETCDMGCADTNLWQPEGCVAEGGECVMLE